TTLDRRYVITRVEYTGAQHLEAFGGAAQAPPGRRANYSNTLECLPLDVPFRPARAVPQPRGHGSQTALVGGPSGEEIYTAERGRIKVQFHWDREGARDERSSCWVRVAQTWAGAQWGCVFLPRVGMEVVVSFLDGDPDRPLVTGCVYNGQNR